MDWYQREIAVTEVARFIEAKENAVSYGAVADRLWRNVLLCAVSSSVRWEIAVRIVNALEQRVPVSIAVSCHRYPGVTAARIDALQRERVGYRRMLRHALDSSDHPRSLRKAIVDELPGFGPKQSSMLLRNLGRGQEIAILDRHILLYLRLVGVLDSHLPPTGLRGYERIERAFLDYASAKSVRADFLDLAIWSTMRAAPAKELR
jgi:N-glycosylase/DNA lyase